MGEWVIGGGVIAVIGLMLTISKMQETKMVKVSEEQEVKIANVYRRMDEVKSYQNETFTRKDMCDLTHKQVTETLNRMECKLDKILNGHGDK